MVRDVVGVNVYNTWIDMLKRLVPSGRTHRLCVVVASMLQYAQEIALEKSESNTRARNLSEIFECAYEKYVDGNIKELLFLAENLLEDAGVRYKRTSSRGEQHSVAEDAVYQYLHWDDMPWE